MHHIRKVMSLLCAAALLAGCCGVSAAAAETPFGWVEGAEWIREPGVAHGSDYTEIPLLAQRLDAVFQGHASLYSDYECRREVPVPLGSYGVPNWGELLNVPGGQRGWSCYIYANGVYFTLFGECPGDGSHVYTHSQVLGSVDGTPETLYAAFTAAGVSPFAYCRNDSHSFLILSYHRDGITLLDGNSINGGSGLIQITEATWEYFWLYFLSGGGNPIRHIVQPTQECLSALRAESAGLSSEMLLWVQPDIR